MKTTPARAAVIAAVVSCLACAGPREAESPAADPPAAEARDIHSFARPDEAKVTHIGLDWTVLFDEKVLEGAALLYVTRGPDASARLHLDTRDLAIMQVVAGRADSFQEATWSLGEPDPHLGTPLVVDLPEGADRVRIAYRTSPSATGLQWLDPSQTAGGKLPFLYSQSQAIHARSWIPCQDSPGIRITFDATVRVAPPLRAVMAAEQVSDGNGVYIFSMPHPIPPYLLALAVGDLKFGKVGPRTGVWAEPKVLDRAVGEFADMEAMLAATEKLYGPYRWGRYDLLVLPPSFPFGGMENPMLTFATPTILAGDRSLVALVAHELAHSWSGNLVTNATWSDFWLNEGFTTYLERRIMEAVYGPERARMEWMLGRQDLEKELDLLADKPADQHLRIDLAGRDPDDGMTSVPYDKGALMLRMLEETYGREAFDTFLRAWFDEHAFESVPTDRFLAFLDERLIKAREPLEGRSRPDVRAWIDRPGIPADAPEFESDALAKVDAAIARWAGGEATAKELPTADWTTQHWLHFLRGLPEALTADQMGRLDAAFGFTKTGNAEVLDEWLVLSIRHDYAPAGKRLEEFLTSQGRRKFLTPLYRELMKTEAGADRARAIYEKARPLYHTIARQTLDELVGYGKKEGA